VPENDARSASSGERRESERKSNNGKALVNPDLWAQRIANFPLSRARACLINRREYTLGRASKRTAAQQRSHGDQPHNMKGGPPGPNHRTPAPPGSAGDPTQAAPPSTMKSPITPRAAGCSTRARDHQGRPPSQRHGDPKEWPRAAARADEKFTSAPKTQGRYLITSADARFPTGWRVPIGHFCGLKSGHSC